MSKKFTRVMSIIMTIIMCMSMICTSVSAASTSDSFPINKVADGLDENDQTNVTLTVPGTIEGYIDVVFILGGGMTLNIETIESAIDVFKPAMESGKATVRIGIISLEKGKEIIVDLNSNEAILDPDTYVDFVTAKFESINNLPAGTTNLHSQLLEAQKMLARETKAKAENKYVFVLATGRTYWFDDANGNEAMILSESETEGMFAWGNFVWQQQRAVGTSYYQIPRKYNNSYHAFFKDIEKWVAEDGDKYVYAPPLDKTNVSSAQDWQLNNQKQTCPINAVSNTKRMGLLIENPAPDATKFDGITFKYNSEGGPNHALNYERAQYECVQVWRELVAAKYNCYAICSEQYRYQNYSSYANIDGIQIGHAFMDYLSKLAGKGKAPVVYENNGTKYGALKENFFDPVRDDMLYNTSIGSTVEDFIGCNENGNFEFIEDAACIKLEVGGVTYTTAKLAEANDGASSSYTFTAPGASEPTFWLDYYYGDGKTTERFEWRFGENVSLNRPASLTYKLQLTEKKSEFGVYYVPTNNSATLYPVDSDGNPGEPQDFPVPGAEYIVREPIHTLGSIVVNKTTTGATTPDNATFQLQKQEGNEWVNVGETVPFSAFVDNAYTFTDLVEGTYRVIESGAEIEEFRLATTYSENVVLTKTTADNGDTSVNSGSILVTNVYDPFVHTQGSIVVNKTTSGATTPADATFQLQMLNGESWIDVGEAVPFSAFVNNAYTFTDLVEGTYRVVESGAEIEEFRLETTYGENVVLTKTTADNGDTSVNSGAIIVTNAYTEIYVPVHTLGSIVVNKTTSGATTPADATFQLQMLNGETWTNVGEAIPYSAFVNNAYTFTELEEGTYRVVESGAAVSGYTLETTYGENVVLTKTTADNGDTSVNSGAIIVTNAYTEIYVPVHTLGSIVVNKTTSGATTPADATFQLQKMEGNDWVNVGEAVAFSQFADGAYTFVDLEEGTYRVVESGAEIEGFLLETTYGENVVLTKTTADNGDTSVNSNEISVTNEYEEDIIEIPDEDVPLADVPMTGDPMLLYAGFATLSCIGMGLTLKKRKEEED